MAHVTQHQMSKETEDCIKDCQECETICMESVDHCLRLGGKHAEVTHIRLLLDCAEICNTSAVYMARGSELYQSICGTCAEVCDRCEQSCRQFGDDTIMREAAEACRRTAQSCLQMAGKGMRKAA